MQDEKRKDFDDACTMMSLILGLCAPKYSWAMMPLNPWGNVDEDCAHFTADDCSWRYMVWHDGARVHVRGQSYVVSSNQGQWVDNDSLTVAETMALSHTTLRELFDDLYEFGLICDLGAMQESRLVFDANIVKWWIELRKKHVRRA